MLAGPLSAETPLSVIDWLEKTPTVEAALPAPQKPDRTEPETAASATVPKISVTALGSTAPVTTTGLIPPSVTGLPASLWEGSSAATLARRIDRLPDIELPALQALLFAMMLSETPALPDPVAQDMLLKARAEYLIRQGALDPALDLLEQSGAKMKPTLASVWFDLSLVAGLSDSTCPQVVTGKTALTDYKVRIYCLARTGSWDDAVLLLNSGSALGLISEDDTTLLTYFLDPETAEASPKAVAPQPPSPLQFSVLAALGEPVPTQSLPRVFANADLGDQAGWKAKLLAAERLARAGAMSGNRLLGIYTERQPAASGGLWDRVEALQRFEVALRTRSPNAISKTLPPVWAEMQSAGLAVPFAQLFAADLNGLPLAQNAAGVAFEVAMLSSAYERVAHEAASLSPAQQVMAGVAKGEAPSAARLSPMQSAISDAFTQAAPDNAITRIAAQGELGVALLMAIARVHDGANGDLESLTVGLSSLRALGQDDAARRAALQILVLDRG